MATISSPPTTILKPYVRGSLLATLESEVLVARLRIVDEGRFLVETITWDRYWQQVKDLGDRDVDASLEALRLAWRSYIRSGLRPDLRHELCFRYFSLLDRLLSLCSRGDSCPGSISALKALLGFECFEITSKTAGTDVVAAGTCTLRNPCYLLAKLKMPNTSDDPQLLPVISVPGARRPELFYHYRQYTISRNSPMSILLYPAVSEGHRTASFKLINSIAGVVGHGADPRTEKRARHLFEGAIRPILETISGDRSPAWFELVDIGAGSGSLAVSICSQVKAAAPAAEMEVKLRLTFVDLEPSDTTRFFSRTKARASVDCLTYVGDDYRHWVSKPPRLPPADTLRVALISKLFNNLSHFSIRQVAAEEYFANTASKGWIFHTCAHSPSICLAPLGEGAKALAISNSRLVLRDGRTFAQASLSEFFRGQHLVLATESRIELTGGGPFLPIRTFNAECLITSEGESVISRLAEACNYVIIEDADLRPQDLLEHLNTFSLQFLTVQDVTKALGLTGNHAYVVWHKAQKRRPSFPGSQIW